MEVSTGVEQTYDNATKVAHDLDRHVMVMVAGHANIGRIAATDFIAKRTFPLFASVADEQGAITHLVSEMVEEKVRFWSELQVPETEWRGRHCCWRHPGRVGWNHGCGALVWRALGRLGQDFPGFLEST